MKKKLINALYAALIITGAVLIYLRLDAWLLAIIVCFLLLKVFDNEA